MEELLLDSKRPWLDDLLGWAESAGTGSFVFWREELDVLWIEGLWLEGFDVLCREVLDVLWTAGLDACWREELFMRWWAESVGVVDL